MLAASFMNVKYEQSTTPLTQKFNLKPPSRKLWEKETVGQEYYRENWSRYKSTDKEKWDIIASPQFIDFSNLSDSEDSFFDNTVIVSTPKPNSGDAEEFGTNEDATLVNSFRNITIINTNQDTPQQQTVEDDQSNKENKELYVVHCVNPKPEGKVKQEKNTKVNKPHCTMINPFSFELREKYKQEHKQARLTKVFEEDKKSRVFRANPVPKFVKARLPSTTKDTNNENIPTTNASEKATKKNIEVWKRKPFIPATSRKAPQRPKTPPLQTAVRAKERKRFDDAIKEKETQREQMKEMEMLMKKKQEEEEIARMRKQTVHKAQPIRKYKAIPQVEKRPLTDPIGPITHKRRRRV